MVSGGPRHPPPDQRGGSTGTATATGRGSTTARVTMLSTLGSATTTTGLAITDTTT